MQELDVAALRPYVTSPDGPGRLAVVASGHFHRNQDRVEDGTLFLQVGTTGGAGPTGFRPDGDVPFSAEILYFRSSADGTNRLIAWDVVQELPATGSFSVQRHVVATDYGAVSPTPAPEETSSPTLATGASGSSG